MADNEKENKYTQIEGLNKTYAHYLLFKNDSPILDAVLEALLPTGQKDSYIKMFDWLNKKHVRGGLNVYGSVMGRLPIEGESLSLSGFDINKYKAMYEYSPISDSIFNPFADKSIANEVHSNQTMIDLIHEMVINYIPTNGEGINEFDDIIKAKDNLKNSLINGYLKGSQPQLTPNIKEVKNINDITGLVTTFKESNAFNQIGKVYEMEAVAELHRHLVVDKKPVVVTKGGTKSKKRYKRHKSHRKK
jgi:hypothetical protein